MQLYHVRWSYEVKLGSGRLKDSLKHFDIVILVNNRSQALRAFEILFHREHLTDGVNADDGELILKRMIVDSRNIFANYLMVDGMDEPLYLTNIRANNYHNIFSIPRL